MVVVKLLLHGRQAATWLAVRALVLRCVALVRWVPLLAGAVAVPTSTFYQYGNRIM